MRPQVVDLLAELVRDRRRDHLAECRLAHALVGEQELVVADDLPADACLLVEAADVLDDERAQRVERGGVGRPRLERLREVLLEREVVGEEEVLLGREVAEDRALGDVGGGGDVRDRRRVVAPLGEEREGGRGDQLARAPLLALPQTGSRLVHIVTIAEVCSKRNFSFSAKKCRSTRSRRTRLRPSKGER